MKEEIHIAQLQFSSQYHKDADTAHRTCILVLGMHRSGTSALTRVLNLLGCGLPKTLVGADKTNEAGHWESVVICRLNDRVLESAGTNWHDWLEFNPDWYSSPSVSEFREQALAALKSEFGASRLFVLKDPRIARLAPFWTEIIKTLGARPLVVFSLRNPLEVAASLQNRNNIEPLFGHLLWLRHVLDAEFATRGIPRTFTSYSALLKGWQRLAEQVQETLGLSFPRKSDKAAMEIEAFLSDKYRHHQETRDSVIDNPQFSPWLRTTFEILDNWSQAGESQADFNTLDHIRTEFNAAAPAFGRLLTLGRQDADKVRDLESELDATRQRFGESEYRISHLEGELDKRVRRVERTENALVEMQTKLNEAEASLAEEQERSKRLDQVIISLEARLSERTNETETRARELNEIRDAHSSMENVLAEMQAKFTEAEASLAEEQERSKRLDQVIISLEARLSERANEVEAKANELDEIHDALNNTESMLAQRCLEVKETVARLATVYEQMKRKDEALVAAEYSRAEVQFTLKATRKNMMAMFEAHTREIARFAREVERRKVDAEKIKAEKAAKEKMTKAEMEKLDKQLRKSFNEIGVLTKVITEKDCAIEQLGRAVTVFLDDVSLPRVPFLERTIFWKKLQLQRKSALLNRCGLFHAEWYLRDYQDVAKTGIDPMKNFIINGFKEACEPNALLAEAIQDETKAEGRSTHTKKEDIECIRTSGLFDAEWYLNEYPDVKSLGMDPVEHYFELGARLNRNPSLKFNTQFYLSEYSDVMRANVNPLLHFILHGKKERRLATKKMRKVIPSTTSQKIKKAQQKNKTINNSDPLNCSTFNHLNPYIHPKEDFFRKTISTYQLQKANQSYPSKIAVFTASTGGYDSQKIPEYLNPEFDYFMFTDMPILDIGFWNLQPINYFDIDPIRMARFIKTHPHHLLSGYEIAIWIDSSIIIRGDISSMINAFFTSKQPIAVIPHPHRTSVYEEAIECISRGKDDEEIIRAQIETYEKQGFDDDNLIETGFMIFDLRHPLVPRFLDIWWREIDCGSRRDQLSVSYAAHEVGIDYFRLTERPNSIRNHPLFALLGHDKNSGDTVANVTALAQGTCDPFVGPCYATVREERIRLYKQISIDIVICVHNALNDVRLCLESVDRARARSQQRIILIDDGSTRETRDYLTKYAKGKTDILLHRNEVANGYTRAANTGIKLSTASFVILLNSDTIVTDGWAEKMFDALHSTPGTGIVGPMSNAASHQSLPDHRSSKDQTAINNLPLGITAEDMNHLCEQWVPVHCLPRTPLVHGFCFGISRAVIDTIGGFDEVNFPCGYGEENDYCFRAINAGFGLVVAAHTYVFHAKSKSYQEPARVELMKVGAKTLHDLHGHRRIERAIRSMQENPLFVRLRTAALTLYSDQETNGKMVSHS